VGVVGTGGQAVHEPEDVPCALPRLPPREIDSGGSAGSIRAIAAPGHFSER